MAGTGIATGAGTRVDVTLKLPQLQNLCKRDPEGYREDYDAQVRRLESECGILALSPLSDPSSRLVELIQFAAAVASSSYKGAESDRIAQMLMDLLLGNKSSSTSTASNTATDNNNNNNNNNKSTVGPQNRPQGPKEPTKEEQQQSVANVASLSTWALQLHRDVRKACVSALILMRNKGTVEPIRLIELFFRIMAVVPDKGLREILYRHIVNDIRNINKKGKRDDKLNRSIQSFLHRVVSTHGTSSTSAFNTPSADDDSATDIAAKRATDIVCELYRRNVWTDERTVAILATAVQSKNTTVMARAIRFFLNIEEKMARDQKEQEEDEWNSKNSIDYHLHSKKTQSRMRHTERQLKNRKKQQKKREEGSHNWLELVAEDKGVEHARKLYPAIELVNDPQGLAEAVFRRVRNAGKGYKFELKVLMINFITRLVGNHELILLPLYPFLQKYMNGHQRDVTAILAHAVQACHEQVPPDEVYGILKTISHNFITERCSEEQMAVGINAARAICARVPAIMSAEESQETTGSTVMDIEAFTRDLAGFANHRDRSVSIAGKSWTNFVREVHPGLLQGKHRGLVGSALHKSGEKPLRYGEGHASSGVEGADLLVEYESKKAAFLKKKAAEKKNGGEGDDEDGEEGWVEVEDSDKEAPNSRKAAGKKNGAKNAEGDDDQDMEEEEEEEEVEDGEDGWVEVEDSDEEAPNLVVLPDAEKKSAVNEEGDEEDDEEDEADNGNEGDEDDEDVIDLSKMTNEERAKLRMEVSATRIFTASDFQKIRKLVEREKRAKRDPREAARRKRAIARGEGFEELSEDDSDSEADSDEEVNMRVTGVVNPGDIMALATRKRQSKAERLTKVLAGREKFESKSRDGGSTNIEKKRKKNFLMSKFSQDNRIKRTGKIMCQEKKNGKGGNLTHENKKRRRKF